MATSLSAKVFKVPAIEPVCVLCCEETGGALLCSPCAYQTGELYSEMVALRLEASTKGNNLYSALVEKIIFHLATLDSHRCDWMAYNADTERLAEIRKHAADTAFWFEEYVRDLRSLESGQIETPQDVELSEEEMRDLLEPITINFTDLPVEERAYTPAFDDEF